MYGKDKELERIEEIDVQTFETKLSLLLGFFVYLQQ
jgi:hypothetical protein